MTIRVLLADDQPLVRSGLRVILEAQPDIKVVGEAGDGAEAVAMARRLTPHVVLMDVRMEGMDGIEATRRIDPPTRILILTTFDLDEYAVAALRAGASGFIVKDTERDDIVRAVRTVAAGDTLLSPGVTGRMVRQYVLPAASAPPRPVGGEQLTAREQEVLRLLARGLSNAEIAERLFVAEGTVKAHVSNLLGKLGLRDRVHAVIYAYETGLLRPGAS
ncbi:MAG TPA: response regulator transcription factor [Candidatus Dormibacteraeota bacterium]|nr:response regulator transcription factor [Candidatus Dormibacteraeota bacterium]